jgi:Ca2+-binding EF-hand superfamily protein
LKCSYHCFVECCVIDIIWKNLTGISVLSHKLNAIYAKLLNPSDYPDWSEHEHSKEHLPYAIGYAKELLNNFTSEEKRPLNRRKDIQTLCTLPYWTKEKPLCGLNWRTGEHYMTHRHHALFWFGKFGPEFLIFLVRLHLLLRSMYIALVVAVFVPSIVNNMGLMLGMVYFVLAMLPVYLEYNSYLQELITTLCQVTNTGLLPNNQAIDEVLRRHKTRGAVRAIIMMTSLVQSFSVPNISVNKKKPTRRETITMKLPQGQTEDEINEIGDVFDMYDADKSGEIQMDELEVVMKSLGYSLTHDQFTAMFNVLDLDGDGSITREEFIDWHVRNHDTLLISKREMAMTMFNIFDTDKSGAIQISNMVQRLQGLNHGLSTDDLMQLVNDLDTNRDGVISLEEFQHLLKDH